MPDPRNIFKNRYKKQTKTYGYGKVAGIEVGTILSSRQECSDRGLHGPTQAGIHGNATYGAYSVVLSGGYEDDEDNGERVWYTGEGGRKNGGGPQIADQDWKNKNNRSLKVSAVHQIDIPFVLFVVIPCIPVMHLVGVTVMMAYIEWQKRFK
ncbi:PUA-like domain-containing protein [Lentinula edodes]|uniref:PUA-like domain-containing protein n=1 Tax=Lentinula edodes TaxID=5353 RepID=UPI001E8CED16|nr:PUA-like domain-containing protein [Lentinula edodes]KAH7873355.1 PUA-like domain-containing protein [Lentinula edodes]